MSVMTDKFIKEDWQTLDIIKLLRRHDNGANGGTANWSEMGCVSGDTIVWTNRAGKGKRFTVAEIYRKFHGLESRKDFNWDKKIDTYVQAFVDGRIRQHKLLNVLNQGTKEVYQITLVDGKEITCTGDHEIMLSDGSWKRADELTNDDFVVTRGTFGQKESKDYPRNQSFGDGRFIDKDGYVRVLDREHNRTNASGHVYEHILIMEQYLQRPISRQEEVHHINEIRSDNRIQNLALEIGKSHKSYHAKKYLGTWGTQSVQVDTVFHAGKEEVYDLVMEAPHHNFVANGIVVHNCYKTSTGLWFIDRKIREANLDHPPSILIITNKSGKGTFIEAVPEILPDYTFLNLETDKITIFVNGKELKLGNLKFCPKEFTMPVVALTHYNVFSYSQKGQFLEDEDGRPLKDENGKFVLKEWKQADYIIDREWDFIWTDEFHRMKDKDSRWTVSIKKIKASVGRHGSTGTGFINRPNEIWSLLNYLDADRFPSYWAFHEKFCEVDSLDGYRKVTGVKQENKAEFRKIISDIGVRRTLDNTHPDIEQVVFKPITVDLNPTQRRMYNEIKSQLKTLDKNGVELYSANVLSLLQRLRQICVGTPEIVLDTYDPKLDRRVQKIKLREPSSKLDAVMEVLEGLQWDDERKEPLVVFSCFKDPIELFKARLDAHNKVAAGTDMVYPYIHMDVNDNSMTRYEKWHDTFPKMQHRVFMSTLQLGGESINLTPAHHLIFLDRSWSPKDNNQGIGRIRRPGQTNVPVVININARNTTDQYIEKVNILKHGWFKEIFGNEE